MRVDGLAAGLFYNPEENPAHAGLEIKEGETVYPLQDGFSTAPGRVSAGLTLTDLGGGTPAAARPTTRSGRTCA